MHWSAPTGSENHRTNGPKNHHALTFILSQPMGADRNDHTTVLPLTSDALAWVPGDAYLNVGVLRVFNCAEVCEARVAHDEIRAKSRIGV